MEECKCCFSVLTNSNTVFYKESESTNWVISQCCNICVDELLNDAWNKYLSNMDTNCKATLKRIIQDGPRIYFKDKNLFPSEHGVYSFKCNQRERSGKICPLSNYELEDFKNHFLILLEHLDKNPH